MSALADLVLDGTDLKAGSIPEMLLYPLDTEALQDDLRDNLRALFTRSPLLGEIKGPYISGITDEQKQAVLCKLAFFANHEHGRDPKAYAVAFESLFENSIMPNADLVRDDARNLFQQVVDQTFEHLTKSGRSPGSLPKRKRGRPSAADKAKNEWEIEIG